METIIQTDEKGINRIASLTLEARPSILNDLQCCENVDAELVMKVINTNLIDDEVRMNLQSYYDLIEKNEAIITYRRKDGIDFGRCNAKMGIGMQCMKRNVRHTLCKDTYIDIDTVNSAPTILYQIIKAYNKYNITTGKGKKPKIECHHLGQYIKYRDEHIKKVMLRYSVTRDAAKELFITYMFGGGFSSWQTKHNVKDTPTIFLNDFKNEMALIADEVFKANKKMAMQIKKSKAREKKKYNEKATVLSYFLQEIESRILETVYSFCIEKEYITHDNTVLCSDGIMISQSNYHSLIKDEFTAAIKDTTGFNIIFSIKDMEEGFSDEQMKAHFYKAPDEKANLRLLELFDDDSMAKLVKALLPDDFIYNDGLGLVNHTDEGILITYENKEVPEISRKINDTLKAFCQRHMDKYKDKTSDEYLYFEKKYKAVGMLKFKKDIIKSVLDYYVDPDLSKKIDKNYTIFAFNNCVFDSGIMAFRDIIKGEDIISRTTGYDINQDSDPALRIECLNMIDSVFEDMNLTRYWLQTIANALFGNTHEKFYIHTGVGGNGKGFLLEVLSACMGSMFAVGEPNFFQCESIGGGKANPTLFAARGARIFSVSEPLSDGKDSVFNLSTLKSLSGGDKIVTRGLYKGVIEYKFIATPIFGCNDIPKLLKKGKSAEKRRIRVLNHPNEFTDVPFDRENRFFINHRMRDEKLKAKVIDPKYINEFMLLFIDTYKDIKGEAIKEPIEVINATAKYFYDNDDVQKFFDKYYEYNRNEAGELCEVTKSQRIKCSDFADAYNMCCSKKIDGVTITKNMLEEKHIIVKSSGVNYYTHIRKKLLINIDSENTIDEIIKPIVRDVKIYNEDIINWLATIKIIIGDDEKDKCYEHKYF